MSLKSKEDFSMSYDALHQHIGHKIELSDVWDWQTNREVGLEIRCTEKDCESAEPLLQIDLPK